MSVVTIIEIYLIGAVFNVWAVSFIIGAGPPRWIRIVAVLGFLVPGGTALFTLLLGAFLWVADSPESRP